MNLGTKTIEPPQLTTNLLRDEGCLIDNLFANLWKHMGMKAWPEPNRLLQALRYIVA